MPALKGIRPLRDGGIEWVFYFRRSEVPPHEQAIVERAKRDKFLRLAVTFGSPDAGWHAYRSTTAVHLWNMANLPKRITWLRVFVHVFTHEPLHHAIGLALAEMGEWEDHEWVIRELGDARWW
ncbi:MAG TPA: hypothetical protein VEY12_09670 [Thermoplasmata archaeon]|nr:hypothetical protein [Thermoplasmata archaeon]